MFVDEFNKGVRIKPLKYAISDCPHMTIEPNRTCDVMCESCYTLDKSHVKSIEEIKEEIDLAVCRRNLQTVTLLGGEPTLHPDINDIIAYVKGKKKICQLLTNGLNILKNGSFLDDLAAAGVDRIVVHVDSGQKHVHRDIDATRHALFEKLERKRIPFSLAITIYEDYRKQIPSLSRRYSSYRYFDGILAVLARDPLPPRIQNAGLCDEYRSIADELDVEPVAYIPSNIEDDYVSWLIYFYFIDENTGRTYGLSPVTDRICRWIYRLFRGHHLFLVLLPPSLSVLSFLVTGFADVLGHPKKAGSFLHLLFHSRFGRSIRFHYIAIQTPPERTENGKIRFCYRCPDATIRNGKVTPVCIADQMNPFIENGTEPSFSNELCESIYRHLGEQ